jgi:hypothetical protein
MGPSLRRTPLGALACMLAGMLLIGAQAAAQNFSGSIFTTTKSGTTVNGNLYPSKDAVYLNGGPQNTNSAGLPDGLYVFQVTNPSGSLLLSTDDITCREVVVSNGIFAGNPFAFNSTSPSGACTASDGTQGNFHTDGDENFANGGSFPVQLCAPSGCPAGSPDYMDTNNPGGEYKVWLTPLADYVGEGNPCPSGHGNNVHGFCDGDSKTDNFKVQLAPPPPCTTNCNATLTACKFWDKDDDGLNQSSDVLLGGWTIQASTSDPGVLSNGQNTGTTVSGVTDSNPNDAGFGCTTFTVSGFPDSTTVITVTLSEVQQPNWNQTAPLQGTYPGGNGGSITVTGCNFPTPPIPACTSTISVPLVAGDNVTSPDFGNTGLDLVVTKTATPSFTRTYAWNIAKAVDKTLVEQIGGTATFNYTVNVNETGFSDSAFAVSGTITVTNPNSFDVTGVNVTDSIDNGGTCSVTNGTNVTVPAGQSVSRSYNCTFASNPGSGNNTATASWDASTFHTPDGSASGKAGYTFGAPTTVVNKTIHVTDCFNSAVTPCPPATPTALGTVTATDTQPFASAKFTYSRTVNIPANNCVFYTNTAVITETGQSAQQTIEVCGPALTGALTMGFWQNKNGQGIISGGASTSGVCNSGAWLRQFPPFQDLSATATCSQVATYVFNVIKAATCSGTTQPCNTMLKAQMLATALDVYFSDPALGGNKIAAPVAIGGVKIDLTKICHMIDGSGGTATCSGTFENVSSAFGGASCMTVLQMLQYAGSQSNTGGSIWYGNVKATQVLAKDAFDAVNNRVAFPCP